MNTVDWVIFVAMWFGMVPPSAALISDDIAKEHIGRVVTAWIDRKFRGGLLAYIARCPRCLSHWVVILTAALLTPLWRSIPIENHLLHLSVVGFSILSGIRLTRGWLE